MHVTVIGGAGSLGTTIAHTLAVTNPQLGLRLVDPLTDAAEGHAVDVRHATNHVTHTPGRALLGEPNAAASTVTAAGPGPDALDGTDCLVVAFNVERPESAVGRGGREEYFERNKEVADELAGWMRGREPCPVVVVTNPVDRITHRLWRRSEWPRQSFLGYSLSESARAADEIGRLRDAHPHAVHCPMMGQHGERLVPVLSKTRVGGDPVSLTDGERRQLLDYVREVPYTVMDLRGAEKSSRWVSGAGVAAVVHTVLRGGATEPVCLSTPLNGEYGYDGVSMSVPLVLSDDGWEQIRSWELSDWERDRLDSAYEELARGGPDDSQ